MPSFHSGRVVEVLSERAGLQRVRVAFDDGHAPLAGDRAYVLTELTGEVGPGDEVVCNTTAVELGLGTGGWHVVHWNLGRRSWSRRGPDHVMKLRYTSLQFDAGTSELAHPDLPAALDAEPVVVCLVHSQVAVVAATIAHLRPGTRVSYVMTDGAALPLAFSDLVATMTANGLLTGTVTAGNAFGGDLEAVSVHSALLLARHVQQAEITVVGMGPGVAGTGTIYGTTALDAAAALDAVAHLEGTPVLCVRASSGDQRDRHRGISHHTRTVAAATSAHPLVADIPPETAELPGVRTSRVELPDVGAALAAASLRVTTMGRDLEADPAFFEAAGAAAALATGLLGHR